MRTTEDDVFMGQFLLSMRIKEDILGQELMETVQEEISDDNWLKSHCVSVQSGLSEYLFFFYSTRTVRGLLNIISDMERSNSPFFQIGIRQVGNSFFSKENCHCKMRQLF